MIQKIIDSLDKECDIEFLFDVDATTYTHPYIPLETIENTICINNSENKEQTPAL